MAKSRYTYDQFRKSAQDSGLWGQFSQADLSMAQQNPDFGMSILKTKQDYQNATTDEARAAAHRQADALRSSWGGYTGGGNGGSFVLDPMSPRNFEYEAAPTYESRYDDTIQDLIAGLLDRPDFSYDPATDPLYQNYRKQYTREGQRATADALGAAAAASGGIPSSYANAAANQASNYYAAQLTDKIPDLYQLAYNQYLNDYNMDLSNLGVVQGAEQSDYDKYLNQLNQYNTDRNFSYGQFLDELDAQNLRRENELNNAILAGQYGDYSYLNNMGINTDNNPTALQQQAELQALAQAQVDNILQTGNMPSSALLQQAGYSQEYANYLSQYYRQQLSSGNTVGGGTSRRSSGGSSGNGGTKGGKPINDDKRTETGGIDQAAIDAAINAAVDISNKISGRNPAGESEWGPGYSTAVQTGTVKGSEWNAVKHNLLLNLRSGNFEAAERYMDQIAGGLSEAQFNELAELMRPYGYNIG
jgi:hypothetical protein|nr:MAG TPA: hypothetical protein [Caudoviricetes sp.]